MAEPLRRLVIGVGNPDRGDDGAGRLVARLLRAQAPRDVRVLEASGDATGLITLMEDSDWLVLVDAVVSGAPPGTIHRFDCAAEAPPPVGNDASSHGLGVAAAIALARALGTLPPRCMVYGLEAARCEHGTPISPAVAAAAAQVAEQIGAELATAPDAPPRSSAVP